MTTLFINGSPNRSGNTARLAKALLEGTAHDTLNLVDYKVYGYGQRFGDDQLDEVLAAMDGADTIVIGSPVYWHNLSGLVRTLLDRLYGALDHRRFRGKRLALLYQGAAPAPWMIEAGEYSIKKFCELYGLAYLGMATTESEAKKLRREL
ncbi:MULTISPECIES: flavodoxin family protein [unclassified Adlercreutzia]|uniref:flavodoxin family protein n=1 Tax=unclassified Adlercreutzia TaxID=2636013 RepID=UPI0013EDACFD|nr:MULTISPECIES: flavodoxin family protein [unclassified Adlercreutzia]